MAALRAFTGKMDTRFFAIGLAAHLCELRGRGTGRVAMFRVAAGLLTLLAAGSGAALAQASGEVPAIPSVNAAVRNGEFAQAANLLAKSAEAGNVEAQYQLASLYRLGRGLPQDDGLAFKWMKKAAERGHVRAQFNLAKMLLAGRGAPVDVVQAQTWLQKAAAQGYGDATQLLGEISTHGNTAARSPKAPPKMQSGVGRSPNLAQESVEAAVRGGRPAIADAAWRGQADTIKQLIVAGADVMARDDEGNTALALAAANGKIAALDALLAARADVNSYNKAGEPPLMLAAAKGHLDVVSRLLAAGADVAATRADGATALGLAVRGCHE